MNEEIFWIWTTLFNYKEEKVLSRVLSSVANFEEGWNLTAKRFCKLIGCTHDIAEYFTDIAKKDRAKQIFEQCVEKGIERIFYKDKRYPELLKHIDRPPRILYVKGRGDLNRESVAIVGSRMSTYNGETVAYNMAEELARNGYDIISGMAKGIDCFAHSGALKGKGGTIAVLGSGVDVIYPYENRVLYETICEKGMVISEFPPETKPTRYNFPYRNRIISGLSLGTVVIEAGKKSGSLITAECAISQGRNVYAVPGDVNKRASEGTNALIRDGAVLVRGAADIIEDLRGITIDVKEHKEEKLPLSKLQKKICNCLEYKPLNIEEIIVETGESSEIILPELLIMEMNDVVFKRADEKYVIVN